MSKEFWAGRLVAHRIKWRGPWYRRLHGAGVALGIIEPPVFRVSPYAELTVKAWDDRPLAEDEPYRLGHIDVPARIDAALAEVPTVFPQFRARHRE